MEDEKKIHLTYLDIDATVLPQLCECVRACERGGLSSSSPSPSPSPGRRKKVHNFALTSTVPNY